MVVEDFLVGLEAELHVFAVSRGQELLVEAGVCGCAAALLGAGGEGVGFGDR